MSSVAVRHDLRGRFGPPRDQEGRETCLAFAMSDAHAAALGGEWSPLSCEYLFYHAKRRDKSPADQGTTVPAIRSALEHDGQPAETGWTYLTELPPDLAQWRPPAEIGVVFRRGSDVRGCSFDDVWVAVEVGRPVVVGMTISTAFFTPTAGVVDADEPEVPAVKHAVVAVGTGTSGKTRALLVRNSWGDAWGLSGYAWLTERYASPRIKAALSIR
jgi:hypothetical protein